jgi:hypothetical protein
LETNSAAYWKDGISLGLSFQPRKLKWDPKWWPIGIIRLVEKKESFAEAIIVY